MTSIIEIYKKYPTQADCLAHLEKVRWGESPSCAYCGADTVCKKVEPDRRPRLQCWSCHKSFSVTVGTIFHNSHVDLQKWFGIIFLLLNEKISLLKISQMIEIRYGTCRLMALKCANENEFFLRKIIDDMPEEKQKAYFKDLH